MARQMRKSKGMRLRFEALENRMMLAGNVIARLDGGSLIIRGDNLDNGVQITQLVDGTVEVTGLTTAGGDTRINGVEAGVLTFRVRKDIKVDLKGGDDLALIGQPPAPFFDPAVHADTLAIRGELKVDMGCGNDQVEIRNVAVRKEAKIETQRGVDVVDIIDSAIGGDLKVKTGDQLDVVGILNTAVRKDAEIETGGGDDVVAVRGLAVGDELEIETGWGNDLVMATLDDAVFLNTWTAFFDAHVIPTGLVEAIAAKLNEFVPAEAPAELIAGVSFAAKEANIDMGGGSDTALITNAAVRKTLEVELGKGDDTLLFVDNVARKVKLDGGKGADALYSDLPFIPSNGKSGNAKVEHFEVFSAPV